MPSERTTALRTTLAPYYQTVTTAAVANLFWVLLTDAPVVTDGTYAGKEITTPGYARGTVAMAAPFFNVDRGVWEIANNTALTFGPFTATVTPVAKFVALTKSAGGPATYWWPINLPGVFSGDSLLFPALTLAIRAGDS